VPFWIFVQGIGKTEIEREVELGLGMEEMVRLGIWRCEVRLDVCKDAGLGCVICRLRRANELAGAKSRFDCKWLVALSRKE